MMLYPRSKVIIAISLTFITNQIIYSSDPVITATEPDSANLSRPASNTPASNIPAYSMIPDYDSIYVKALPNEVGHTKINSMAVAELNRQLQMHGYFEFSPVTYPDITRLTKKYDLPVDLSFSRETQRATVTWNKGGLWSCLCGIDKIKIFETSPIPTQQITTVQQKAPKIRPENTPLTHSADFLGVRPSEARKRNIPAKTIAAPRQKTTYQIPINQANIQPPQPQKIAMSAIAARNMLRFGFSQFSEIAQNNYIALEQSNQIIRDLMQHGPARFEPRYNNQNALFLAVIREGQIEEYYKLTYRGQR